MCGLCGVFGVTEHWTDGSANSRAESQHRVEVGNRFVGLYGLRLAEWSSRFTLTSHTGGSAVVEHFGLLWPVAERLAGRPCDPLDPAVIRKLDGEPGRP